MRVGDIVRWIGFPGASVDPSTTGPTTIGLIIKVWSSSFNEYDTRINVLWASGKMGNGLYPETVEVVNEGR